MSNNIHLEAEFTLNEQPDIQADLKLVLTGADWGNITGDIENQTDLQNALNDKQDVLTAGDNIQIEDNVISATDTTYTAGEGISIENNVISNTLTSAEWGNIEGDIADQTDLNNLIDSKVGEVAGDLDIEETARINADTHLQENIDTLSGTVSNNYTTLDGKITDEATARGNADSTLDGKIGNNKTAIDNHKADKSNPHEVTKAQVGLGNVDNTSDADKPISTATQNALNNKQDTLTQTQLDAVNSGANTTNIGQIATNTNDIDNIEALIPNQATSSNQLADKDFVNSSIATNTANFIGTFETVTNLEAYSGTVTNNDYAFVINSVVTDNGNDWATFSDLDAYDKDLLTNFDYGWVINGSNFNLYRFDIVNQEWVLRVEDTAKASVTLNTAYNRYKATVSNSVVSWEYEYTLNNSSFTAGQWEAINSGITSALVTQIGTNQTNIGLLQSGKQDTLTAGSNIQINNNVISATDTTYTAGTGIDITNGVISNTQTSADWGSITGDIEDQTDLKNALDSKQGTITGGASTVTSNDLTANRALVSNSNGKIDVSSTTYSELNFVHGITGPIQGQLNNKLSSGDNVSELVNDEYYLSMIEKNTWTQPVLSSDGTLGGNSFAVGGDGTDTWKAFDNDSSTYMTFSGKTSPALYDLIVYNPIPLIINKIDLLTELGTPLGFPVNIYGSNDNITYTEIATNIYAGNQFDNITPYKYYKFSLEAVMTFNFSAINLTAQTAEIKTLSNVAYTGNYDDLSNKPTIPAAQVNSDWNASSGVAQILNKPTLSTVATTGDYDDLTNKPTIPAAVTVDSALSSTSTNPVQNKVINSALSDKYDASNPNGYTSNVGTVTSVNNVTPVNGNVSLTIPAQTDVKINNTSITSGGVANIVTNGTYNASSNKIATMSDVPTIATSVSSSSTNSETVGAKLFYDTCGDIETLINAL